MDTERYHTFTAEDFIIDKYFRQILKNPDAESLLEEFISNFPDKRKVIILAADIVKELNIKTFKQAEERKKELWQKIAGGKCIDFIKHE